MIDGELPVRSEAPCSDESVRPREPAARSAAPLIGAVRLYQRARADAPSPCRFVPSCSTYAVEALEAHGPVRGTWLAARRLCRCHPWGGEGFDPVPERSSSASTTHDREVC